MKKTFFVDEKQNIFTGQEAEEKISKEGNNNFISDSGVVKVDKKRWEQAQSYETHFAMKRVKAIDLDINKFRHDGFDGYKVVEGKKFKHAIELGCGVNTNLKYIADVCDIEQITLEDPLIDTYLKNKYRNYSNKYLYTNKNFFYEWCNKYKFTRDYAWKIIRRIAPHLFFRKVSIYKLYNQAIEDMDVKETYDLVVIINVLDHCYDVNKVFENIKKCCHDDTIIIFQEKLCNKDDILTRLSEGYHDAGHPLLVDKDIILNFLKDNFIKMYDHKVSSTSVDDLGINGDDYYYIGKFNSNK